MPFQSRMQLKPHELYYAIVGLLQRNTDYEFIQAVAGQDGIAKFAHVYQHKQTKKYTIVYYPGSDKEPTPKNPNPTLTTIINQVTQTVDAEILNNAIHFYPVLESKHRRHFVAAWVNGEQDRRIVDPTPSFFYNLNDISIITGIRSVTHHFWQWNNWACGYYVYGLAAQLFAGKNPVKPIINKKLIQDAKTSYTEGTIRETADPGLAITYDHDQELEYGKFEFNVIENYEPTNKQLPKKINRSDIIERIENKIEAYKKSYKLFVLNRRGSRIPQLQLFLDIIQDGKTTNFNDALDTWKKQYCKITYKDGHQEINTIENEMSTHYNFFFSKHRPGVKTGLQLFIEALERDFNDTVFQDMPAKSDHFDFELIA